MTRLACIGIALLAIAPYWVQSQSAIAIPTAQDCANARSAVGQQHSTSSPDENLRANLIAYETCKAENGISHLSTITAWQGLAFAYGRAKQPAKAAATFDELIALSMKTLGEEHATTQAILINSANVYSAAGQMDKAIAAKQNQYNWAAKKWGLENNATLNIKQQLSDLQARNQPIALSSGTRPNYSEIERREALLTEQSSKLGSDHPQVLATLDNLAQAYRYAKQFDKSIALDEQVLSIYRKKYGENHGFTISKMATIGNGYLQIGHPERAAAILEQAQAAAEKTWLNDEFNHTTVLRPLLTAYQRLGQQDKAVALIPRFVRILEHSRQDNWRGTNELKSLREMNASQYLGFSTLYAQAHKTVEGFDVADLAKARSLLESVRSQTALRMLPPKQQNELESIDAQIQALDAQLDRLVKSTSPELAALQSAQTQLANLRKQRQQLWSNLLKEQPKFAQLTQLPPASAAQAKELLKPHEAFVSFLYNPRPEAGQAPWQAYVVTKNAAPLWRALPNFKNHASVIAAYREQISPSTEASLKNQSEAKRQSFAEQLSRGLLEPLANDLQPYTHWIISPDSALALLPFDTLPISAADRTPIGTAREISLVQSFSVYAMLKIREKEYASLARSKDLLAIGNPVYAPGWESAQNTQRKLVLEAATAAPTVTSEQQAMLTYRWGNLPGTAQEIAQVSQAFGKNADLLTGAQASESQLQTLNAQGKLKDYRYLLFSAHGYLAQNPQLSALVLSQIGNPAGVDGYITAQEWPLYDIRSDLTVLSACDTGVGQAPQGESVMGLPFALFVAGNRNALLSLWPVDDAATAEFMRRFFSKLKARQSQIQALTQTKREFMSHPEWRDPRYWAAFVLYGV